MLIGYIVLVVIARLVEKWIPVFTTLAYICFYSFCLYLFTLHLSVFVSISPALMSAYMHGITYFRYLKSGAGFRAALEICLGSLHILPATLACAGADICCISTQLGYTPEVQDRELDYTLAFCRRAPNNESAWNYLRGMHMPFTTSNFESAYSLHRHTTEWQLSHQ